MMSAEEAEEGAACGGGAASRRHTWAGGAPHGSQGRPQSEEEAGRAADGREGRSCRDACGGGGEDDDDEAGTLSGEDGADLGAGACKAPAMHSNCSSDTCIPTPSCRICFQGAEQVRGFGSRRGGVGVGAQGEATRTPELQLDWLTRGASPR